MAKKTITTCDVTGKEGAETITLPIYKRIPNPAGKAEYEEVDFDVDLSPEAKNKFIQFLMMRMPARDVAQITDCFFRSCAAPDLAQRITERLEAL